MLVEWKIAASCRAALQMPEMHRAWLTEHWQASCELFLVCWNGAGSPRLTSQSVRIAGHLHG